MGVFDGLFDNVARYDDMINIAQGRMNVIWSRAYYANEYWKLLGVEAA